MWLEEGKGHKGSCWEEMSLKWALRVTWDLDQGNSSRESPGRQENVSWIAALWGRRLEDQGEPSVWWGDLGRQGRALHVAPVTSSVAGMGIDGRLTLFKRGYSWEERRAGQDS